MDFMPPYLPPPRPGSRVTTSTPEAHSKRTGEGLLALGAFVGVLIVLVAAFLVGFAVGGLR